MLCRDVPPSNPATELVDVCQEFISMPHFHLFSCTFLNAHRSVLACLWDSADREAQCSLWGFLLRGVTGCGVQGEVVKYCVVYKRSWTC